MKLSEFVAIILPMFFICMFFLISYEAFAQNETQKLNVYEGLGLKMKYFSPWSILVQKDEPNCHEMGFCQTHITTTLEKGDIEDFAMILITQDKMESSQIKSECKCDILLEYVKYKYENTISGSDNFFFINDNQTTLANNNKSAIQLEYELSLADNEHKAFTIFTKDNTSFYHFAIYVPKESYPKYVADFKKMIDSLEFVSTNEPKIQKQPSFMMDTKESNNTSPIQNLANENVLDLSNNGKQQLSESLESNNKIDIPSHNSYINSIGHLHVIGEVENNSPVIAEFVKIIGTFYDANGNVVGTSSTYADPTDIHPGEKAPFDLILSDSIIPADQINKYLLKISYR